MWNNFVDENIKNDYNMNLFHVEQKTVHILFIII